MNNNSNGLVIGITMVIVLIVGFFIGRMTSDTRATMVTTQPNQTQSDQNTDTETGAETSGEGTEVSSSQMTDGQRKMLKTMGIDPNNVTITPEMIACAEAKVGAARVAEIQGGATPSIIEGGQLLACYGAS